MRAPIFLLAAALVLCGPVAAQQVYKWKDANGATHYSDSPPARGAYTRRATVADPVQAAAAPATGEPAAAVPNDPRCDTARRNIAALTGSETVRRDTDDDGKGDRVLTPAERASHLEIARATLKAYGCSEAKAP